MFFIYIFAIFASSDHQSKCTGESHTTPCHAKGNGQIESFNETVCSNITRTQVLYCGKMSKLALIQSCRDGTTASLF